MLFGIHIKTHIPSYAIDEASGIYSDGIRLSYKKSITGTTYGDFTGDILIDNWCSGWKNSVDIKRGGKQCSVSGGKINIDNTGDYYNRLRQSSIEIKGRLVDIYDLENELLLYKGFTGDQLTVAPDILTIPYDSVSKTLNSNIGTIAQQRDDEIIYNPVLFGSMEKAKLFNTKFTNEDFVFNGNVLIYQFFTSDGLYKDFEGTVQGVEWGTGYTGVRMDLYPNIDIDYTLLINAINAKINSGIDMYVSVMSGEGEGEMRRIEAVSNYTKTYSFSPTDQRECIKLYLDETIPMNGRSTVWNDKDGDSPSYIKIIERNIKSVVDSWVIDEKTNLDYYVWLDKKYNKLGNYVSKSNFEKIDNGIMLGGASLTEPDKLPVKKVVPVIISDAGDEFIPYDIPGPKFQDHTWTRDLDGSGNYTMWYMPSNSFPGAFQGTTPEYYIDNTKIQNTYDSDHTTIYGMGTQPMGSIKLNFTAGYFTHILKVNYDSSYLQDAKNIRLLIDLEIDGQNETSLIENSSFIGLYSPTRFSGTPTTSIGTSLFARGQGERVNIFNYTDQLCNNLPDDNYFRSANFVTGESNRGAYVNVNELDSPENGIELTSGRIYPGENFLKIDFEGDAADPLIKINNFFYVVLYFKVAPVSAIQSLVGSYAPTWNIKQMGILCEYESVSYNDGIYSNYTGRKPDSPDLTTGLSYLSYANEIYNHICRLQNFSAFGVLSPVNGWGSDYINRDIGGYDEYIDNSSNYGGMVYNTNDYYRLSRQIYKENEFDIKKLKDSLLSNSISFNAFDRQGVEKLFDAVSIFRDFEDDVLTEDYTISFEDYDKIKSIQGIKSSDIFCAPKIEYNFNMASEKYSDYIQIVGIGSNQKVIDISNPMENASVENLYRLAINDYSQQLYEKYKIINTAPNDLSNLKWIADTKEALKYLRDWLWWQGADFNGDTKDIFYPKIEIKYHDYIEKDCSIGDKVLLYLPMYGNVKSLLTSYSLNFKTMMVELSFVSRASIENINIDTIIESGDRTDDIIESGSRTDNYIEVG